VTELALAPEVASAELDRMFPGETITLRQLLEGVAELLAEPQHWTTGALAKDSAGRSVSPTDPTATCWCGIGATYKVYYDMTGTREADNRLVLKITQRLMQSASQLLAGRRVESFNDGNKSPEFLGSLLPLALAIIENAVETQQGAFGEELGPTQPELTATVIEHMPAPAMTLVETADADLPTWDTPGTPVDPNIPAPTGWDETATGETH